MFETIKSIGSLVGLLTGVIYFYDRLAKGRPLASLTIIEDGNRKFACVRITNISEYDVAILKAIVRPEIYFLVENLETRSLVEGASGQKPYFMLKPGQEKALFIAAKFKDGIAIEVMDQRVAFWIYWRRANVTWLPQLPIWVWTRTSTIRKYALERGQ
jgi:hypothetical protein